MDEGEALLTAVRGARRPEVRRAVRAIYADLDREIAGRRPRCDASGKCCDFDAYGHRLYVTTAELATFVSDVRERAGEERAPGARVRLAMLGERRGGCVYQVAGLCSVHEVRPFGCRIYFCDPTASEWMTDAYERFHGRLKRLHEELGVPYQYVEWRRALAVLEGEIAGAERAG